MVSAGVALSLVLACGARAPAPRTTAKPAVPEAAHLPPVAEAGVPAIAVRCGVDLARADEKRPPAMPWGGRERSSGEAGTCGVNSGNIRVAEDAIAASTGAGPAVKKVPWDHRTAPRYTDIVDRRLRLTTAERAMLFRQGFVVPARLEHASYAWALHDIYQSQLPIFVSVDAVLHAIYASNDELLATIEESRLARVEADTLEALACALPAAALQYPPDVAKDLDLYLTVARSLLAGKAVKSSLGDGVDLEAAAIVLRVMKAEGLSAITLFGRTRNVDWSLYTPRGHYATERHPATLAAYFRAATWLSRLELNLVSRVCPSSAPVLDGSETPREATVAIALSDLAERANAMDAIDLLDRAWGLLGGKREDVSVREMAKLRARAKIDRITIPESFEALKATIGKDYQRTARLHYVPLGCSGDLPAIATMLGPRVVPDTTATRSLVHPDVPGRDMLGLADMMYAFGHDQAKAYAKQDLAMFPELAQKLDVARAVVQAPLTHDDLYSSWLGAIRALGKRPEGVLPSFMDTPAYADLRLNSAVAAFGQIRHNYVLLAGQGYNEGGCEIPDGYVEPAPAVYEALIAYARRGEAVMAELDPKDAMGATAYFAKLGRTLKTLKTIGDGELAGRVLTVEERRFLSLVVEMTPATSDSGPTYTGWYFDLFRTREGDGLRGADFIADYFTSLDANAIAYAGVSATRLGVFVVDSGGVPRLAVGPVSRAYEHVGRLASRVDDEGAKKLTRVSDPWAASYTVAASPAHPFALKGSDEVHVDGGNTPGLTVTLRGERPLGAVTVELLDHHYVPYAGAVTRAVGTTPVEFKLLPQRYTGTADFLVIKAVRIRIGETSYVAETRGYGEAGSMRTEYGGAKRFPYPYEDGTTP